MLSTYLWCAKSTHFSKVILLLMSSIHSALPSGASLTLFGQLFVESVIAVRLLGLRSEFEPRRAHLLARGPVPISEILAELHAEETRLRSAG